MPIGAPVMFRRWCVCVRGVKQLAFHELILGH